MTRDPVGRNFPVTPPAPGTDPRFTFGLVYDVSERLAAAGYPTLTGLDFVDLEQALFRFLYRGVPP